MGLTIEDVEEAVAYKHRASHEMPCLMVGTFKDVLKERDIRDWRYLMFRAVFVGVSDNAFIYDYESD
jgi:hypothetical protein